LPGEIEKSIKKSDFLVLILSKDSVKSKWVKREIDIAYSCLSLVGKPVILPLLLEKCTVPPNIEDLLYADFRDEINYEGNFQKILHAMDIIIKKEIENQYTVLKVRDISYALAMRVQANVLLDKGLPRSHIKRIIQVVNEDVKNQAYARDEIVARKWGGQSVHIVALFYYESIEDSENINWICKTLWNDPGVHKKAEMHEEYDEMIDLIEIKWSKIYGTMKELYRKNTVDKKEYIKVIKKHRLDFDNLFKEISQTVENYNKNDISNDKYVKMMRTKLPEIEKLNEGISNLGLPPYECRKADKFLQGSVILLHNVLLPFSDDGLIKWDKKRRDDLVSSNLENYKEEISNFDYEYKQVL